MTNYKEYQGYKGADPEVIRSDLRSSNGIMLTEALFEEVIQAPSRLSFDPVYTLREHDSKGKISAYQVYMNSVDETDAALKLVGSMLHWRKLCSLKWFMHGRVEANFEGLAKWRQDMADRDRTTSKAALLKQVAEGNVSAARALDKMATDELKRLEKLTPKKSKSSTSDDGLEFLNDYRG